MELPFLDTSEILRDGSRWRPLTRGEAVQACRAYPIAVVHRIHSRHAAAWLDPANRFFKSDGPYLYEGLRYFLFTGAGSAQGISGANPPAKPEPVEMEPLEAMDVSGEALNLGSPAVKKPAPPGLSKPAPPGLPDLMDIPDIPDLPNVPDLDIPSLPVVPGIELALDLIPQQPVPGGIASLAKEAPAKAKRPVEILLTDEKDQPLADTPVRVEFPDGRIHTGTSDGAGFIRFPDNTQEGELLLILPESRDKAT
ncbi:MAG TPA: hypothetical protein VJ385_15035 [Fibrobacteria bacterium]|nr:hypothetical protein [Fibrobacteria bacterium]